MESFWKKVAFTATGFLLSSAIAWLVIYPYVILPRLGVGKYSLSEFFVLMLVGFFFTLIILGATIRNVREFVILAVISGILLKLLEAIWALIVPYASQSAFTEPLEFWTIGVIFSIIFSVIFMLIGLPFGWLVRRFRKPELQ